MSALTQRLREEHGVIARLLARVREEGAGSGEGRRLLESLRFEVERHFAVEERLLFPPLREAARNVPRLKATVELLARQAVDLSDEAGAFFRRAREGASGLAVARDFGWLYGALGERMRREEATLFPALERQDGPESPSQTA
jgi:iron-sulfur cluster repair protein YtfE (RIC family)